LNRNAELIENVAALSKHNTKLLDAIIEMKKQEDELDGRQWAWRMDRLKTYEDRETNSRWRASQ
jgi:hypothetical protein